jgi:integrase
MHNLEDANEPHIRAMLRGRKTILSPSQQQQLAHWAVLKAMVIEETNSQRPAFYTEAKRIALKPPSSFLPIGTSVWIAKFRYAGQHGMIRREKAGNRGAAIKLYQKRKTEVLQGKKLPESFRPKMVTFSDLADDAMEWSKANKLSWEDDQIRLAPLVEAFGSRPAESITPQELERWLRAHGTVRNKDGKRHGKQWSPVTFNRYKALVSMVFRQGIKNRKTTVNPAKEIAHRKENNVIERYLKDHEERKLRAVITDKYPEHLPEFELALHTGMRRGEQYTCEWSWVDLDRQVLTAQQARRET